MSGSNQVPDHTDQKLHVDGQVEFYDPQYQKLLRIRENLTVTSPRSAANNASQASLRTLVSVEWNLL